MYIFWICTFMPCRQYERQQQGQVVAVSHAGPSLRSPWPLYPCQLARLLQLSTRLRCWHHSIQMLTSLSVEMLTGRAPTTNWAPAQAAAVHSLAPSRRDPGRCAAWRGRGSTVYEWNTPNISPAPPIVPRCHGPALTGDEWWWPGV